MENIELFDRYINDELSEKERHEFDARLKDDKSFADDFKVYSVTVIGICKEAEQDNKDFEMAMKKISKDKLKEIIGWQPREKSESIDLPAAASALPSKDVPTITSPSPVISIPLYRRQWLWQVALFAILVVSAMWIFNTNQNARYSVDNAIFACVEMDMEARSGEESIDISNLSAEDIKSNIPVIESIYRESKTDDDIADNGYVLAMAYLKIHDRDKAKTIFRELIAKFNSNENYAEYVYKWQTILNQLK